MGLVITQRPQKQISYIPETSRWNAIWHPTLFKMTRKDYIILSVTELTASGFDSELLVNGVGSDTEFAIGDKFYLKCGIYDAVGTIEGGIASAFGIFGFYLNDITFVQNAAYGYGNCLTTRKYYYSEVKVLVYNQLTGVKSSLTDEYPQYRPNSKGEINADLQTWLQSILTAENKGHYDWFIESVANIGQPFNIEYREIYKNRSNTIVTGSWTGATTDDYALNKHFIVNAAKQVGDKWGQNMALYNMFPNAATSSKGKFLTMFDKPKWFEGYPFDLSFIYSEEISAINVYKGEVSKDLNGNNIDSQIKLLEEKIRLLDPIKTIAVGDSPEGIAIDNVGGRIFYANTSDNTIYVFDMNVGEITTSFSSIGAAPEGIGYSASQNKIFVCCKNANKVYVFSGLDYSNTANISVASQPWTIVMDDFSLKAYVGHDGSGTIEVLNTVLNTVAASITSGNNQNIEGIFVEDGFDLAFIANENGKIKVIDPGTNTQVGNVSTPASSVPNQPAYDPVNQIVWVTDRGRADKLIAIDPGTLAITDYTLPVSVTTYNICYNTNLDCLMVTDTSKSFIYLLRFNSGSNSFDYLGRIVTPQVPYLPAYSSYNNKVYTCNPPSDDSYELNLQALDPIGYVCRLKLEEYDSDIKTIDIALYNTSITDNHQISEKKTVEHDSDCYQNKYYLAWLNPLGGFDYWLFNFNQDINDNIGEENTLEKYQEDIETPNSRKEVISKSCQEDITLGAILLSKQQINGLRHLLASPKVLLLKEFTAAKGASGMIAFSNTNIDTSRILVNGVVIVTAGSTALDPDMTQQEYQDAIDEGTYLDGWSIEVIKETGSSSGFLIITAPINSATEFNSGVVTAPDNGVVMTFVGTLSGGTEFVEPKWQTVRVKTGTYLIESTNENKSEISFTIYPPEKYLQQQ